LIVIILIWYLISFIFVKLFIYWYKKDELHPDSERWQIIQKNAKADKKVFWYFALYATVAESLRIILKFNQAEYDPYKTCYFFCQLALLALIVCQFYKFIKPDNKQVKPFSKFTIFALIALGSILYSWFFLSFLIFICLWGFRRIAKSARLAYAKRNWKVDFLHCLELLPRLNKWTTFILLFSYTVFFIPLKSLGISLIGITTPIILVKLLILVILGLCFLKLVFEPIIKIKNIFSFELNRIFGNQGNSQLEKSSLICFGISLFACFVSFWTIADMSIYPINLRIENINQTQDKDNHNELRNERDLYLPWKAANKISNVKIIGKTNEALILDKSTIHNLDLSKLEIEEIPKNLFIIKAMDEFFVSYMKIWQDLLNNTGQWPSGDSWEDKFFQVDIKEMETQKEKFNTYTPAISLRGATISGTIKFPSNVKVGLTNADLTNADLTEANLENADLTEAILPRQVDWVQKIKNKSLVKVNLTKTDLTKTDLTNAELTNAELENAKLTNTKLKDSILINANLKGTESSGILVCGLVVDQLCEAISIWNTKLDKDLLKEVKEKPACKNKLQFPSKELIEDADIKLEEIIENEDLSDADLNGSEWISDKSIFCKASKFPAKEKIPKEVLEVIQNKCPDKLTK
ncbi:MAG: pentapeptide repeat-containing protein, partial [Candidatus Melainabacteria bacterium]